MIAIDSAPNATPNGRAATPWLQPPNTPWTDSPRVTAAPRLTAEQIEAIIVRAEAWAREERARRLVARLGTLRPGPHVHVPADWREQASAQMNGTEPSPNRVGDA